MTFELLVEQIENGKTFEQICKEQGYEDVECIGNQVYDDDDLYEFLNSLGARIEDFNDGYAQIMTNNSSVYEVLYKEIENRHGNDLPDETLLFFEPDKIYDVTDEYMFFGEEICPHCDHINEFFCGSYRTMTCRNCGKKILLCSLCDMDEVDCSKCPFIEEVE